MRQHPTARINAAAARPEITTLTAIRQAMRTEFAAPPVSFPAKAGNPVFQRRQTFPALPRRTGSPAFAGDDAELVVSCVPLLQLEAIRLVAVGATVVHRGIGDLEAREIRDLALDLRDRLLHRRDF